MNLEDTLLAFSEWLDGEGFRKDDDERTHEGLTRDFIADWQSNPNRAPLAGAASNGAAA